MNIMLAVTNMTAANGGVTTHIVDLCRELAQRQVKVFLVSDSQDCDYWDKINELEKLEYFTFCAINMEKIQSDPKHFMECTKQICKIVRREKIDLIHAHSQSLCLVAALVKVMTGTPYIWTNHIDEMANPKLFRKVLKFLQFPIISVSTDLKMMLTDEYGVSGKRITVVNNGINTSNFYPLPEEEKTLLKAQYLGKSEEKYIVSILARMSRAKGHMYLLEAINSLQQSEGIDNIQVLIAGKLYERGYWDNLCKYAQEHGINVKFLGFQNPREIFGISDISVLPSIYEGFGLTVIESLAMGCPVIRSDTPGWMDTKGIALVFNKKNVEDLEEKLLYAYRNKEKMKEMGLVGREVVLSKFTIQAQVENTMNVYQRYIK